MVFRWSIITDNQLVGVLNQALEPKNLFQINWTILHSLSLNKIVKFVDFWPKSKYAFAAMTWCSDLYWHNNTAVMGEKCSLLSKIKYISQKYLAIPASSVPSERVFSLSAPLVNKKRARLSPSDIGNIISWIKTWNIAGNNIDNYAYTISVWMTMFCFLWTVQSNLFVWCCLSFVEFSPEFIKFVHSLWIYKLMW